MVWGARVSGMEHDWLPQPHGGLVEDLVPTTLSGYASSHLPHSPGSPQVSATWGWELGFPRPGTQSRVNTSKVRDFLQPLHSEFLQLSWSHAAAFGDPRYASWSLLFSFGWLPFPTTEAEKRIFLPLASRLPLFFLSSLQIGIPVK